MRLSRQAVLGLALTALVLPGSAARLLAEPPAAVKSSLKPEVAALIKASTDIYKKMKSYRHTAVVVLEGKDESGVTRKQETRYTLALDRPNKFVYKDDSKPATAAVSDGKTFINYKSSDTPQYTKQTAPTDYKGINIVDDVTFEPLATYIIALMLQGDALADKDVRAALEKATLKPGTVTENGKKWQVITFVFGGDAPTDVYFNAEDHLIGKSIQKLDQFDIKIVETYENVSVNKPIDATVFQYTPPANAQKVEKFRPVQKPDDARNSLPTRSHPVLTAMDARNFTVSRR